jgi:flagellar biosynthetic protein FliS
MKTDAQVSDRARRDYLKNRILTAHPLEIVEMLYHTAMDALNMAISHLNAGDVMSRAGAVSRAQEAVNELTIALDHSAGASFSRTLAELYAYVQQQIIKGHTKQSEAAFREALSILTTLLEGWSQVRASVCGTTHTGVSEPSHTLEETAQAESKEPSKAYAAGLPEAIPSRDWSG